MRKLLTAVSALVAALAFFVVGSPSANAFGSEVLGCDAGGAWSANSCESSALPAYHLVTVNFSPHNTSGTYSTSWYVHNANGVAITQSCYANYGNTPCFNGSCPAGSMQCSIVVRVGPTNDKVFTAALTLTQSGQTRTITAAATIPAG
ncbi:hypothetical protein [Jatrophihabitans sp.]|uniref:hypothetical protein n=1 Tax=Jatrophihabitans sp. TaxID=1932789 RepID=UPI002CD087A6|nr:hypothetical protein [Jatrophihabitans sp.]